MDSKRGYHGRPYAALVDLTDPYQARCDAEGLVGQLSNVALLELGRAVAAQLPERALRQEAEASHLRETLMRDN